MELNIYKEIGGYFDRAARQYEFITDKRHNAELEQEEQREKYLDMLRDDFEQALECLDLSGSDRSRSEAATKITEIAEYVRRGAEA